jgi:hypothetical protein
VNKCLNWILVMVISGSCETNDPASLTVISAERGAVVVEVHNGTSEEIIVLSPEAPSRQIDEEQCVLLISTRITDDVQPYAFTPTLESVEVGATKRFRAVLEPVALSTTSCTAWTIDAEYAYVLSEALATFKGRPFEDFRQYVLHNQKVVRASAKLSVRTE